MASRMRWGLGLVGLCVLTALAVRTSTRDPIVRVVEQQRVWQLQSEIRSYNSALMDWAALDSVEALLPPSADVTVRLRADLPDSLPGPRNAGAQLSDSAIRIVSDALDAQLARIGGSRVRLAVVALPSLLGRSGRVEQARSEPIRYFAGSDDRGAWCAVVAGVYGPHQERETVDLLVGNGDPLGPCRLWARYGAPGAGIRAWLPHAGYLMSRAGATPPDPPASRRSLFGIRRYDDEVRGAGMAAQACLGGRADACPEAVLDRDQWLASLPRGEHRGPALHARSRFGWAGNDVMERLFADLERELGTEDFARVWRADAPVEPVLEDALDADLGTWLLEWARARFGTEPRGPLMHWSTWLLSVLALLPLVGAALAIAQRRRVA